MTTNSGSATIIYSGGILDVGNIQISGSGNFTLSSGATLKTANVSGVNGSLTTSGTKSLSTGANYEFNGTSEQVTGTLMPTMVNNLVINNSSNVNLSQATTVSGTLVLTNGLFILGSNTLTLGISTTIAGTPSATNMIVAVGTGELRKYFTSIGSFTFPVGDNTGIQEYSPVTLNFTSGTFSSAYCGVKLSNTKHPNNTSATDYLIRYWTVTQSGITDFSCDVTLTYLDADVEGTESNIFCGSWNGSSWALLNSANTAMNQLTGTVNSFSDYTGGEYGVLPVELTSFTANVNENSVQLMWNTAIETNNYGFEVERRRIQESEVSSQNKTSNHQINQSSIDNWKLVGFITGAGTSNTQKDYSFTDTKLSARPLRLSPQAD